MNQKVDELKRRIAELEGELKSRHASGPRPSTRLWLGLAAFVIVFAAVGYGLHGNREGWAVAPGDTATGAEKAEEGHDTAQFEAIATKLAARLKETPDDAEGWLMLARTYMVMQRFSDAIPAFKRVAELRPKDADVYADWADALAMVNGRQLAGEPEKLIAKALKNDPNHVKGLSLAGTVAFDRGDMAEAARLWEQALRAAPPGSEAARRLQGAIDEARTRGGLPAASTAVAAAPKATPSGPAAAGASVSGEVALSEAMKKNASPDDLVIVYARPNDGSKAPLALVQTRVRDLPYRFTLDDTSAMNPARPLSAAQSVIIGARVSKSGGMMPQAGDLQGFSEPVKVGQSNVRVEIGETLR